METKSVVMSMVVLYEVKGGVVRLVAYLFVHTDGHLVRGTHKQIHKEGVVPENKNARRHAKDRALMEIAKKKNVNTRRDKKDKKDEGQEGQEGQKG